VPFPDETWSKAAMSALRPDALVACKVTVVMRALPKVQFGRLRSGKRGLLRWLRCLRNRTDAIRRSEIKGRGRL